jgi:hypothetical protein
MRGSDSARHCTARLTAFTVSSCDQRAGFGATEMYSSRVVGSSSCSLATSASKSRVTCEALRPALMSLPPQ